LERLGNSLGISQICLTSQKDDSAVDGSPIWSKFFGAFCSCEGGFRVIPGRIALPGRDSVEALVPDEATNGPLRRAGIALHAANGRGRGAGLRQTTRVHCVAQEKQTRSYGKNAHHGVCG